MAGHPTSSSDMFSTGFLKKSSPIALFLLFSRPKSVDCASGPSSDDIADIARAPSSSLRTALVGRDGGWLSRPRSSIDVELGGIGRSNDGASSSSVPLGGGGLTKDDPPPSPARSDAGLGSSKPELAKFRKLESSVDKSKLLSYT